jgi:hypothetical protein
MAIGNWPESGMGFEAQAQFFNAEARSRGGNKGVKAPINADECGSRDKSAKAFADQRSSAFLCGQITFIALWFLGQLLIAICQLLYLNLACPSLMILRACSASSHPLISVSFPSRLL